MINFMGNGKALFIFGLIALSYIIICFLWANISPTTMPLNMWEDNHSANKYGLILAILFILPYLNNKLHR